jgi:hypothetical protein
MLATCALAIMPAYSPAYATAQQSTPAPTPPETLEPIASPGAALPDGKITGEILEEETAPPPPQAQNQQAEIVVRGLNERKSSWKRMETDHVIIYSNGTKENLRNAAADLDRLHHLLSVIFGRVNAPTDAEKLNITLIGNGEFMDKMDLTNWRSAEGPFGGPIREQRYYDPRIDGAVMAVSRQDFTFTPANTFSDSDSEDVPASGSADDIFSADPTVTGRGALVGTTPTEVVRPWKQAMFAGFAQHYVTTTFPSAYPRWYIDGIGALFSTMTIGRKGQIEYGRTLPGFGDVYDNSGSLNIRQMLEKGEPGEKDVWSPYHAWLLAHFFFVSPDNAVRKQQLAQYMSAIHKGQSPADAAKVFGDMAVLQKEVDAYGQKPTKFGSIPDPNASTSDERYDDDIVALNQSDAALLKAKVELGSRLILPPAPGANVSADMARKMQKRLDAALKSRTAWLAELRKTVAELPWNADALLLLAEAECRIGDIAACVAAADQVLAKTPADARAASWKGMALVKQAAAQAPENRTAAVKAARKLVIAANRASPNMSLPLIAFFRSYVDAGEKPPEIALKGMMRVIQAVPNAPEPRLLLAEELVRQSRFAAAKLILFPLVNGPWDSPERQRARAMMIQLK